MDLSLFLSSLEAVGSVLAVAMAGVLLVRLKVIDKAAVKTLSSLVFTIMLPCLLWTNVASLKDLDLLKKFIILPVACVISVFLGMVLSYLFLLRSSLDNPIKRMIMTACAFGNTSFLPIPFLVACCAVFPALRAIPDSADLSITFVSLYLILYSPMLWTLGKWLLSGKPIREVSFSHVLNPPVIGMILGVATAFIPPIKSLFFSEDAPLRFVLKASSVLASGTIPCALLVLGAGFSFKPEKRPVPPNPVWLNNQQLFLDGGFVLPRRFHATAARPSVVCRCN
mgnify:CR=1 FL=1